MSKQKQQTFYQLQLSNFEPSFQNITLTSTPSPQRQNNIIYNRKKLVHQPKVNHFYLHPPDTWKHGRILLSQSIQNIQNQIQQEAQNQQEKFNLTALKSMSPYQIYKINKKYQQSLKKIQILNSKKASSTQLKIKLQKNNEGLQRKSKEKLKICDISAKFDEDAIITDSAFKPHLSLKTVKKYRVFKQMKSPRDEELKHSLDVYDKGNLSRTKKNKTIHLIESAVENRKLRSSCERYNAKCENPSLELRNGTVQIKDSLKTNDDNNLINPSRRKLLASNQSVRCKKVSFKLSNLIETIAGW